MYLEEIRMGARQETFRMFARYNRWANMTLYRVAAGCSAELLSQERGAFFHSILGTLNHLVVTDRMWLCRMQGNSPKGTKLDEVLYYDFSDLWEARKELDASLLEFVVSLEEPTLAAPLAYQTSSGTPQSQPLHEILSHLFNHQTHHRGQAHDLLGQALTPAKTPVLDLLYYQRAVAPSDTD
jgi:uncharacterized damage-inducible protein DinB